MVKGFKAKKGVIVVSVGDDGAIVTAFEKGKLSARVFAATPYSSEFSGVLAEYGDSPIYVLLDNIDQNYVFTNIPSTIGAGNAMKMVKRKLTNEFDKNDLNSYMALGKDPMSVRKDFRYMFVSVRNSPPLSDWLDAIYELQNKFMGVYLYPLESQDFVDKIRKAVKNIVKVKDQEWEILIAHNRVGGFRQVVMRGGKIIFTRISQSPSINSPESIGVSISQEIISTLEYIRRIGYIDEDLTAYVVCNNQSFQFIDIPGVKAESLMLLSPFDVAQKLNLKDAAQDQDKYGDVIFATSFIASKKSISFKTEKFKESDKISGMLMGITGVLSVLPVLCLGFAIMQVITYLGLGEKKSQIQNQTGVLQVDLNNLRDFNNDYGYNPKLLSDFAKTSSEIGKYEWVLQKLIRKYKSIDVLSTSAQNYTYELDAGNFKFGVNSKFSYSVNSASETLLQVNNFKDALNAQFSGLTITLTGLPDEKTIISNTDTADQEKVVDMKVELAGTIDILAPLVAPKPEVDPAAAGATADGAVGGTPMDAAAPMGGAPAAPGGMVPGTPPAMGGGM